MRSAAEIQKVQMPNILLVAGNGRNVGKTHLACGIIRQLSQKEGVVGVKISAHFHPVDKGKVIVQKEDFKIIEEDQITQKDSSLLLQAGAKKVYFVMANQPNLDQAFLYLNEILPKTAIVCESGGLHEYINPGLFLFVKRKGDRNIKKHLLKYHPVIVENDGVNFNLNISNIKFSNNRFSIL
jgi:hypothetical protein